MIVRLKAVGAPWAPGWRRGPRAPPSAALAGPASPAASALSAGAAAVFTVANPAPVRACTSSTATAGRIPSTSNGSDKDALGIMLRVPARVPTKSTRSSLPGGGAAAAGARAAVCTGDGAGVLEACAGAVVGRRERSAGGGDGGEAAVFLSQ